MKKIVATVLAMVMALALCTTAFAAAQTYDVYGDDSTAIAEDVVVKYYKADADESNIAYYVIEDTEFEGMSFVRVGNADDADYVLKLAGKKTVAMYLAEIPTAFYDGEGTVYTDLGTACGKFDYKDNGYTKNDKFYTAVDDDDEETYLFVKVDADVAFDAYDDNGYFLLVDGKIVPVLKVSGDKLSDIVVEHKWVLDDEKGTAVCSACNATGKVYDDFRKVPSGATAEQVAGKWVVADKATVAGSATDTTATSPKTFDAGIAMYVGMALTSVAGSAVVIGKKKEF